MEKKEQLTKYLNAIYQNTKTATQSIEDIILKVKDTDLINELSREQDEYSCLVKPISKAAALRQKFLLPTFLFKEK